MNRLQAPPESHNQPPFSTALDLVAGLGDSPSETLPSATFLPKHYERGYAYPLLVWLHGAGQSERDLPLVMPHISTRNYIATAPRGPLVAEGEPTQFTWSETADSVAEERIFESIGTLSEQFNIRQNRVFIAGVGSGGTMALRMALSYPETFAGGATLDGPLPTDGQPLSCIKAARNVPFLLIASRKSSCYPEARLCQDLRLLHAAGSQVGVRQYPGSDDLTTAMLADLDRWMMEIVCQRRSAAV